MNARCDEHVGEPFPPRCKACDEAEIEAAADRIGSKLDTLAATAADTTKGL
ncbi:hypothetical protein JCM13591A_17500 [Microbacterium xylanilyticum]